MKVHCLSHGIHASVLASSFSDGTCELYKSPTSYIEFDGREVAYYRQTTGRMQANGLSNGRKPAFSHDPDNESTLTIVPGFVVSGPYYVRGLSAYGIDVEPITDPRTRESIRKRLQNDAVFWE